MTAHVHENCFQHAHRWCVLDEEFADIFGRFAARKTSAKNGVPNAASDVRFGSQADMCNAKCHVRFSPNSDRESEIPQKAMSALPPKADMCGALVHVC